MCLSTQHTVNQFFTQSPHLVKEAGPLRHHAEQIADGYGRYKRTGTASGPNTEKAYEILAH